MVKIDSSNEHTPIIPLTDKKKGGEVIASGGFGCVFKPALKCKGQPRVKNMVSKLMEKRFVNDEYKDIQRFKPKLQNVPNYKDYYLIDNITKCVPDTISKKDLESYNAKCRFLQKKNATLTTTTVKKNLMLLNMPDGGVELYTFIDNSKYDVLPKINNLMIDLLKNGILPMNKLGIYHSDIKDSNLLVKDKIRLIDWGLSVEYTKKIPELWSERTLQYNVPFSSILFNPMFEEMYSQFLKQTKEITMETLRPFVIHYMFRWFKYRGEGHYKAINRIFKNLFVDDFYNSQTEGNAQPKDNSQPKDNTQQEDKNIESHFTNYYVINYLCEILIAFTKSKKFHYDEYINKVFSKIIDIWGFIMSYNPIVEKLSYHYNVLNKVEKLLFSKLKQIFLHYLFLPRVEPIIIDKLVHDLKELNPLFEKCSVHEGIHSFNGTSSQINTSVYSENNFVPSKYSKSKSYTNSRMKTTKQKKINNETTRRKTPRRKTTRRKTTTRKTKKRQ